MNQYHETACRSQTALLAWVRKGFACLSARCITSASLAKYEYQLAATYCVNAHSDPCNN